MPKTPADIATDRNALKSGETALLGTVTRPDTRIALVRHPSGRITRLSLGDRLDGNTVTAIGDGELHLTRNGKTTTLSLPKG